jgi:hypothetical protein
MTEILSFAEIQTRYDGEWVLIGDPEVYRQARLLKPTHSAFLFIGRLPKDAEVVL